MKLFSKISEFLKNEPNLKALFSKPPKTENHTPPSPAERAHMRNRRNFFFFLFFPIAVFYMEVVFHFSLYGEFPIVTFLTILLFSFAYGFLVNGVALLMPLKANRIFTLVMLIITTLVIVSQYIYTNIFGGFYTVSVMALGADAINGFSDMLFAAINKSWLGIILLFLPLIIFIAKLKKYAPAFSPTFIFRIYLLVIALLCHLLAIGIVSMDKGETGNSNSYYYKNTFEELESVKRFGVVTNMRLDIKALLFGVEDVEIEPPVGEVTHNFAKNEDPETTTGEAPETTAEEIVPEPIVYGDNVMDIDFETLIANESNKDIKAMHEYFANLTPSKQNEYTGMFKGKNLIFLTLEGFSYTTIDPERTPTLYMMANNGFVLKNFYTSLWGGSTATGEYAAMTGNFHSSAKCLGWLKGNTMPFTMGTQLREEGYVTYAFHNNLHDYYSRNLSHPVMGYEFIAIGNGLEDDPINENGDVMSSKWPRSDYEMALATLPYYINSDVPFHAYYMTVSGHAEYNFLGNTMAKKHQGVTADMACSDTLKAYHAAQYEVELMLAELVRALDEAGKLEDTVFVMSSDHYPYGLTDALLGELYNMPETGIRKDVELLRNTCIIWCADMEEPVIVEKPCSAIDIIPTVSNLFGIEYDSRLLMGTDVLSDSDPLVILNCLFDGPSWCWMTQYGLYNSSNGKFTPAEGFTASQEDIDAYVKQMNNVLWAKRRYSPMILEKNYYSYLFKE
ncbi:MAG: LTA synthase family protein [Clostridia bacterium]|nr:LTA synthase family protein [Clostridia bacterium]